MVFTSCGNLNARSYIATYPEGKLEVEKFEEFQNILKKKQNQRLIGDRRGSVTKNCKLCKGHLL